MSGIDFGLSRSPRDKSGGAIGLPKYDFLYVFNSNIWPNSAPLRDIKLLTVKSNGVFKTLSHVLSVSIE